MNNLLSSTAGGHGPEALIRMRGITKVFHTGAGDFPVLKGIDVDVYPGEFVSVVGRSGSGKSTLVNMLTGIDHPSAGSVQVGDTLIHHMPESKMAVWRGNMLGIVFQFFQLLPMLSLVENVMLPMDFCSRFAPAEREARALDLLRRVGLAELARKLPGAISGGQQQSVAVARALANDPPIIIADEPTGNLDSRTAEEVIQLFEELVGQGKTILMVTHDQALARRTSRSLLISDGELVDPTVAAAFPDLPHPNLLRLGKLAQPLSLPPGARLTSRELEGALVLVAEGSVELVCAGSGEAPLARLAPPRSFDPRDQPGAELRAGPAGARLLRLDRSAAQALLSLAPAAQPLADSTGRPDSAPAARHSLFQRLRGRPRRDT